MKRAKICLLVAALVMAGVGLSRADEGADPAILKNEIVLKSGPGAYMEVRHIVLKGTNEEIGKALADIAREQYNTNLVKYAEPIYARARHDYMKLNYPIMFERMKGVARSYGLSLDETDYDTSGLYYWMTAPKCSGIFIPAAAAENGHNFYASNRDYYLASMSEVLGGKRKPGEEDFSSRVFVVEMYPDKGYSSLGVGVIDLLSINIDAINSKGLSVAVLEDDTYGVERTEKDLSRLSGLYIYQIVRLIVDTCATVDEAKEAILNNKIPMAILPAHFLVMDSTGRSFIYERSAKNFGDLFVDSAEGKPVPITNHSIHDYPALDKFPAAAKDDYDTFNRYGRLDKYVRDHRGKYSMDDAGHAMSLVYGRVEEASESGYHNLPLRTLYTALVDIDERAMRVRFYLKDGERDPKTGFPELIFSEPLEFKLKPE
ncbi:MAG: linear amide C-N hydrolase [Candidatus Omnitrophica bacterium]|nr:linear amide C-N hydrolase [Candidatus Omnitrophota bacterium]